MRDLSAERVAMLPAWCRNALRAQLLPRPQ